MYSMDPPQFCEGLAKTFGFPLLSNGAFQIASLALYSLKVYSGFLNRSFMEE